MLNLRKVLRVVDNIYEAIAEFEEEIARHPNGKWIHSHPYSHIADAIVAIVVFILYFGQVVRLRSNSYYHDLLEAIGFGDIFASFSVYTLFLIVNIPLYFLMVIIHEYLHAISVPRHFKYTFFTPLPSSDLKVKPPPKSNIKLLIWFFTAGYFSANKIAVVCNKWKTKNEKLLLVIFPLAFFVVLALVIYILTSNIYYALHITIPNIIQSRGDIVVFIVTLIKMPENSLILGEYYMVFEYCPKCGQKLGKKEVGDEGLVPFCGSCNRVFFSFSYTCVLCLAVDENENVVLTKKSADSNYGCVAGYVKEGETVENAAKREVQEEIGLTVSELKFVKSRLHNTDTLMINFICKVRNAELKISEKELHSAEWFTLDEAQNIEKIGVGTKSLLTDYCNSRLQDMNKI